MQMRDTDRPKNISRNIRIDISYSRNRFRTSLVNPGTFRCLELGSSEALRKLPRTSSSGYGPEIFICNAMRGGTLGAPHAP